MTAGLMCCVVVLLSYVRSFLFQYFLFRHRCSIWFRWLYEEFWEHNILCKWKQFWCLCHLSSRQAFVSKNAPKKGRKTVTCMKLKTCSKTRKMSRKAVPFLLFLLHGVVNFITYIVLSDASMWGHMFISSFRVHVALYVYVCISTHMKAV